jgi:vancomycin resistance protein YoaR
MITKKIISLIGLIFLFLFLKNAFYFLNKEIEINKQQKIYPYVYINNINFGEKKIQQIVDFFNKKNEELKKITILILYQQEIIATFSAQKINLHFDSQGVAQRAYFVGRSSNLPSRIFQKIVSLFGWQKFNFQVTPSFDYQPFYDFIKIAEDKYNQSAKNALFKFENGRVIAFAQEVYGQKIDEEKFYQLVEKEINQIGEKKKKIININLPIKKIEPEIKLTSINNFGIEEKIGEGKSDYSGSIPERIHNLILAASKFNGVLIPPEKTLSFNETVGDISQLTGYKPAYIIKDGKTILGDGGGVCQVSTTLFRAALNTGLEIVERHPHAYRVSYYENDSKPGFDATVFAPYIDLKIKNNTPAYILIETEIDKEKNLLYFYLFGKKDKRSVEISTPLIWDISAPPPPKYQVDPTFKKGVVKQIDFPAWGAKVNFHYKVIKNKQIIFEKDFFSSYRPWQAVYLVGTAE